MEREKERAKERERVKARVREKGQRYKGIEGRWIDKRKVNGNHGEWYSREASPSTEHMVHMGAQGIVCDVFQYSFNKFYDSSTTRYRAPGGYYAVLATIDCCDMLGFRNTRTSSLRCDNSAVPRSDTVELKYWL